MPFQYGNSVCRATEHSGAHRGHQEPDIDVSNLRIKEGRVGVAISHYRMEHFPCGVVTVGRPDASADSSPEF